MKRTRKKGVCPNCKKHTTHLVRWQSLATPDICFYTARKGCRILAQCEYCSHNTNCGIQD